MDFFKMNSNVDPSQSHDTANSAPPKNPEYSPGDDNAAQEKASECIDLPTQSLGEYLDSCGEVEKGTSPLTQWLSSQEDPWYGIGIVYGMHQGVEVRAETEPKRE